MLPFLKRFWAFAVPLVVVSASPALAQQPAAAPRPGAAVTVCGVPVAPPTALPPNGSGPVLWLMAPCFEAQGNVSLVDI